MSHLPMAVRKTRAEDRTDRRATFLSLLGRTDRLTPAERALLVEYGHAEAAAADALRSTLVGLERALEEERARVRAAETAIVEAERDRAQALDDVERLARYLVGARQACGAPTWPDVPYTVRRMAADRARQHAAYRSARQRAVRGQAARDFAADVADLADRWILGDTADTASCGPALLTVLDSYRERLWPSA
ncbi:MULTISPECIES: hypothetical protein [unclassified Streptomyces]|uniref:hypothetical protein n=1 Tax=unclassified Streptomyces TaxID=2593676 RepID=UPI0016606E1F|nr:MULTISPECIES: hypothetical protein [unclassified Streptomyces]MBD0707377.1 hypothetical protein [Streptomyces sp. CBMA291]MBD0715171.1 hypothetical protein [Streptomyces sp. CBMA370]